MTGLVAAHCERGEHDELEDRLGEGRPSLAGTIAALQGWAVGTRPLRLRVGALAAADDLGREAEGIPAEGFEDPEARHPY